MKPIVVILVESDPRISPRPAEAIRVAAGLSAQEQVAVRLCLLGPAVFVLGDRRDPLVDEASLADYLPLAVECCGPILVSGAHPSGEPTEARPGPGAVQTIEDAALARVLAEAACLLRF